MCGYYGAPESGPMDVKETVVKALKGLVQKATARGLNTRFVYMNILRELGRTAQPIGGVADLRRVKFVGEKTCQAISAAVLRLCGANMDPSLRDRLLCGFAANSAVGAEEGIGTEEDVGAEEERNRNARTHYTDSSCVILDGETLPEGVLGDRLNSSLVIEDSGEASAPDNTPGRTPSGKGYIPGYRTAPYAILKALFGLKSAHKYLIALKAAPFTDAEFDRSQKFSAFKTLESKNLVFSESSRFFLTEKGAALCRDLFVENGPSVSDDKIKLVIDSRERKNQRNRGFFQAYFNTRQVENTTRFLGLGDFLWVRNEVILNHIIERKSGTDFVSSISDGRYREQKQRLKMFDFRIYYLIENMKCSEAGAALCLSCLMETKMDGFVVLETDDINESGEVICMLDRRIRQGCFSEEISYGSFIEEGARQIDVHTFFLSVLLGVRGLGRERAVGLAGRFGTMSEFCRRAAAPGFAGELAGTAAGGRRVGKKMALRIVHMLL